MPEPAGRLVAWPARYIGRGLDHGGERIERRPMPRAGRPEYSDRRRADGRGHVQQAGVVRYRHGRRRERQDGIAQGPSRRSTNGWSVGLSTRSTRFENICRPQRSVSKISVAGVDFRLAPTQSKGLGILASRAGKEFVIKYFL